MAGIADMFRDLALERDRAFEHRREGGEVVVGACLGPHRLSRGSPLRGLLHQLRRNAREPGDPGRGIVDRPPPQILPGRARELAALERHIDRLRRAAGSPWTDVPAPEILTAAIFRAGLAAPGPSRDLFSPEPAPVKRAGAIVLAKDIRAARQPRQGGAVIQLVQVQRGGAFAVAGIDRDSDVDRFRQHDAIAFPTPGKDRMSLDRDRREFDGEVVKCRRRCGLRHAMPDLAR